MLLNYIYIFSNYSGSRCLYVHVLWRIHKTTFPSQMSVTHIINIYVTVLPVVIKHGSRILPECLTAPPSVKSGNELSRPAQCSHVMGSTSLTYNLASKSKLNIIWKKNAHLKHMKLSCHARVPNAQLSNMHSTYKISCTMLTYRYSICFILNKLGNAGKRSPPPPPTHSSPPPSLNTE